VKVPLPAVALPVIPTLPTSAVCHPGGSVDVLTVIVTLSALAMAPSLAVSRIV
jgi:hypothetical protein